MEPGPEPRERLSEGEERFESLRRRARMTRLPPRRAGTAHEAAAIFAFDLLSLAGEDLRNLPLLKRKAMLQRVLRKGVRIRYLQHVEEQGEALYRAIAEAELEGIVAKKADAPADAKASSGTSTSTLVLIGAIVLVAIVVGAVAVRRRSRA